MTSSDPRPSAFALTRRGALGLLASAGVGAALSPSGVAHAAPSGGLTAGGAQAQLASALSRPDRVFLNRGLMHGAWLRNNSDVFAPSASTWLDSGFTTPTFYDGYPLWNPTLMAALPQDTTWSVAKAPYALHLNDTLGYPDPNDVWLTTAQLARVDDLFTVCFGDEDVYSERYMTYLIAAYARMHERYPDVLVHTNQAIGQFSDTQMRSYIQRAKPDLITFDYYYWENDTFYPGGSISDLYRHTARYRRLAKEGLDGGGTTPIAFGQYTCGFRLTPDSTFTKRRYVVSESQQKGVAFVTLAMGGKWLDLFRWEGSADGTTDTDGRFMQYPDGSPTPQFTRHKALNRDLKSLSPYLVRLRNVAVQLKFGTVQGGAARRGAADVEAFSTSGSYDAGAGVTAISAVNLGTTNGGLAGDVLLGTFRLLPNMSAAEAGSLFPAGKGGASFMIVNALIVANNNHMATSATDYAPMTATGGNGVDTRQRITVTVNPSNAGATTLFRVDRATGIPTQVTLTGSGSSRTFTVDVPGGEGEFFYWA